MIRSVSWIYWNRFGPTNFRPASKRRKFDLLYETWGLKQPPPRRHTPPFMHVRRFKLILAHSYQRIMDRIHNLPRTELSIARKVLRLMTCARRPLKWHEIQGAVSISTQDLSVDFAERKLRVHIRDICGPLINQLAGDRLELVHSSAKG